jgi:ABC-type multidrug transport system fused ATPase/permease subunit
MPEKFVGLALEFVKSHPALSAANLALALALAPIGDVLLPHLYGRLVSRVERKGHSAALRPTLLVVAALAAWQSGYIAKDLVAMQTQPRVIDYVRTRMVAALIDANDGNFGEQPKIGQLVSKLVRSPELVSWWLSTALEDVIPYVASLAVVAAYFWAHDGWLAASMAVFILAVCLLLCVAPRECLDASVRREFALQEVDERADDVIRNLASVYGADAAADELAGLSARGDVYRRSNIGATLCLLRFKAAGVPLIVGFVGAVVLRCVHLVSKGRMTVGAFVSVFMMATTSVGTLSWLVMTIKDATLDVGTLEHAQRMFWARSPPPDTSHSLPDPLNYPRAPLVELRDVSYFYLAGGNAAVDASTAGAPAAAPDTRPGRGGLAPHLTLSFEAGGVSVLDGPVGCGKSTLLRLLAALTRPAEGDVFIDGVPYSRLGLANVRRGIVGYMPQDAVLFDRTAGENMIYGAPLGTTEATAERVARDLGLWDAISPGLPRGLATRVGKGGSRLSGGQRQLIWFIRLAIRNPPVLVLDEPTASMDAETRDALIVAIERLRASRENTVVMATHDAGLASFATRTVELRNPAGAKALRGGA